MDAIKNYLKDSRNLAFLSALLIPLKLSFCLVFLIPMILLWFYNNILNLKKIINANEYSHLKPLFIFYTVALYCSFFGIDPLRSIMSFPSLIFFSFAPFAFCDALRGKSDYMKLAGYLLLGQSISGLYSVVKIFIPSDYQLFLGAVTQSGQIALTLLLSMGVLFYFNLKDRKSNEKYRGLISTLILGIALVVNLKRGPWMGVIVGSTIFLATYSKKTLISFIACVVIIALSVPPVQDRILASYEHFAIIGGREAIWDIGSELALRYPLGIGYHNSHVLTKFSTEIPENLKHFHSNILNVLVESGWLGMLVYLWWIYCLIRTCWGGFGSPERNLIARSLGCAFISWQAAGVVEYNFGDSEIFIIVMILCGILANLRRNAAVDEQASES